MALQAAPAKKEVAKALDDDYDESNAYAYDKDGKPIEKPIKITSKATETKHEIPNAINDDSADGVQDITDIEAKIKEIN